MGAYGSIPHSSKFCSFLGTFFEGGTEALIWEVPKDEVGVTEIQMRFSVSWGQTYKEIAMRKGCAYWDSTCHRRWATSWGTCPHRVGYWWVLIALPPVFHTEQWGHESPPPHPSCVHYVAGPAPWISQLCWSVSADPLYTHIYQIYKLY